MSNNLKIFITGVSGYLAGALCRALEHKPECERIFGMDVKKPLAKFDKLEFKHMDINDPALVKWVSDIRPDVFIHLAYILEESHDAAFMHRINLDGSKNALLAAKAGGVSQFLFASSGTAYGAWPDNPAELRESAPLRANPGFHYAVDKQKVEGFCNQFQAENPKTAVCMVRPCVVYGPLVNNYISDLLGQPVIVGPRGYNPPLQFIHEDDLAGAILRSLEKRATGPVNLAPEDTITMLEIVEMSGRPSLFLPDAMVEAVVALQWKLRIPWLNFSTAFLDYIRYPWVLDSSRVRNEIGYKFKYSSRETVEILMRAKGWIK